MAYINWKDSSFIIQTPLLKWYSVESLIDYLEVLRKYILQQGGAHRDPKAPILASTPLPASEKQRFEGYYVCQAVGDYGYKLDEIGLKVIKLSNNACHRLPSTSTAELDVLHMIHDMRMAIESRKDIMDQCSFEDRYGLVWKTTLEDKQEHDVMACPNIFCRYYKNTVVYVSLLLGKTVCNKN